LTEILGGISIGVNGFCEIGFALTVLVRLCVDHPGLQPGL